MACSDRPGKNTSTGECDCGDGASAAEESGEAFHGSVDYSEMMRRGIDPERVIDFSTNVNPFGPSPRVREAVNSAILDRYPDRHCLRLREAISRREAVPVEQILVGNGSSELLQLLTQTFIHPCDQVAIVGPTYAEYDRASRLAGSRVIWCRATAEANFAVPVAAIEAALQRQPRIAFICNPNNPTGQITPRELLLEWVVRFPATRFVVDESYVDFSDSPVSVADDCLPNLIVLRSLTKSHALAGLRLGYAIADRDVIGSMCQRRVPWSVSAPAQAAGVAAIEDHSWWKASLTRLRNAKSELVQRLTARGFEPLPSSVNFFLVSLSDAASVREQLLSEHILVRDCQSFGIRDHIRIGVRTPEENERLIAAIRR